MEVDLVKVGEDSAIVKTFLENRNTKEWVPCQRAYVEQKKIIIMERFLKTNKEYQIWCYAHDPSLMKTLSFQISKAGTRTALVFHSFLKYQLVFTTRNSFSCPFSHFTKANIRMFHYFFSISFLIDHHLTIR